MSSSEFYVKAGLPVDEVVDDIADIMWRQAGKLVARNSVAESCPGDKAIAACTVTRELMNEILQSCYGIDMPCDSAVGGQVHSKLEGNKRTAKTTCDDCGHACQASHRVREEHTPEKIRFMFEAPGADGFC